MAGTALGATSVTGAASEVADFAQRHGLSSEAKQELQALLDASITLTNKRVTVCVPATAANLGPGLEVCGLAIDIWDEYTLEYSDHFSLEIFGDSAAAVPRTDQNPVVAGATHAFQSAGLALPALRFSCTHRIPVGKGLGSACAAFVGGFLAGSVLCTEELALLPADRPNRWAESVKDAVSSIALARSVTSEGSLAAEETQDHNSRCTVPGERTYLDMLLSAAIQHGWNPGNLCPAVYGAMQIGINTGVCVRSHRVPVPNGLVCVVFVPDSHEEGNQLPEQPVDRKAAIFNVGRVALLINCFCTGDLAPFQKATEDALAQPHCKKQFPFMEPIIQVALSAGATGACPCGYGPSVMALTTGRSGDVMAQSASNQLERNVAAAMLAKAEELGVSGQVLIAKPADVGAHVIAQKSELGATDSGRIAFFQ